MLMNKTNKELDTDIEKRFAEEEEYQPKQITKKKRRRPFEIVAGVVTFLIMLFSLWMMLSRFL